MGSVFNFVDVLDLFKILCICGNRIWIVIMVCLVDINVKKILFVEEKIVFMKVGLGVKKIQFNLDDEEDDVFLRL